MVRLRLLTIGVALVVAASLSSCSRCYGSRRVEVPRLAGQILDKRTGKPIEGMAVYQFYETHNFHAAPHETIGSRDFRWTMTDADGRFEFPAHVVAEALKNYVEIGAVPTVVVVHKTYGRPLVVVPDDRAKWRDVVWNVDPDPQSLQDHRMMCDLLCRDLEGDAYEHCFGIACDKPLPKGFRRPKE